MFGAASLTDDTVRAASEGSKLDAERVARALEPQVRLMVMARLSPTHNQWHAVDDLTQAVMLGWTTGRERLQQRTVGGLRAFVSTIVDRRVSDHFRGRAGTNLKQRAMKSLDSTVGDLTHAAPLWQCLSVSGTSPLSAANRADQLRHVLAELGTMTQRYREIITFAFFDQLATAEIASRLDMTRPAVSMLLIRAVKALRRSVTGSSRAGISDEQP